MDVQKALDEVLKEMERCGTIDRARRLMARQNGSDDRISEEINRLMQELGSLTDEADEILDLVHYIALSANGKSLNLSMESVVMIALTAIDNHRLS